MDTIANLKFRLQRRVDTFELTVDERSKEIVRQAILTTAAGTPVDKGRARSNWRISAAVRTPSNVIPPYAPGENLGINETANLQGVADHARRVLALWRPAEDRPATIFNNWDQIERLNDGEISLQGRHFIEAGQQKMIQLIRSSRWIRNRR